MESRLPPYYRDILERQAALQSLGLLSPPAPRTSTCRCNKCGRVIVEGTENTLKRWIQSIAVVCWRSLSCIVCKACSWLRSRIHHERANEQLYLAVWLTAYRTVDDEPAELVAVIGFVDRSNRPRYDYPTYSYPLIPTDDNRPSGLSNTTGELLEHKPAPRPPPPRKPKKVRPQPREKVPEQPKEKIDQPTRRSSDVKEACAKQTDPEKHIYVEQKVWSSHVETPIVIPKPKAKVKTRPTTKGGLSEVKVEDHTSIAIKAAGEPQHDSSASKPVKVMVNATSKQTLCRLFSPRPTSKSPIHFDEFVAAMVDAGFLVEHSGRAAGSAVVFKNERVGGGTISFHRPHPDPKIDHHKLRTWGKRLNQKFGWDEASFVEGVGGMWMVRRMICQQDINVPYADMHDWESSIIEAELG